MTLSKQTMEELKQQAKEELARRKGLYNPVLPITLSAKQEAFINDPSKRKVARCGRRGGKSIGLAVYYIRTMLNKPKARCLYLTLTREQSREILWEPMLWLLRQAKIPHVASKSELKITLQNKSFLRLFGADSDKAKNRLLGQPWDLVGTDECGYMAEVDELVTRVIMPSLTDYDGTLCLTSSPPAVFQGLFYEADAGSLKQFWSQHHWDLRDNPFYAGRADQVLEDVVNTQFGGNWNHPTFRREYLGEWVAESEDRIYPVGYKNIVLTIPEVPEQYRSWTVLGLDLGLRDPNAISVLRAQEDSRDVHELDSWKQNDLTVDQLAAVLTNLIDKHHPISIEADCGGFGAGIVNELRKRYSFNITAADKREKLYFQEIVKADMLSGYCKFLPGSLTVKEMQQLVRDPKTGQEDERCDNHNSDAYLYAYRKIYNRHLKHFKTPLTEEDKILKSLISKDNASVQDKSLSWWESEGQL